MLQITYFQFFCVYTQEQNCSLPILCIKSSGVPLSLFFCGDGHHTQDIVRARQVLSVSCVLAPGFDSRMSHSSVVYGSGTVSWCPRGLEVKLSLPHGCCSVLTITPSSWRSQGVCPSATPRLLFPGFHPPLIMVYFFLMECVLDQLSGKTKIKNVETFRIWKRLLFHLKLKQFDWILAFKAFLPCFLPCGVDAEKPRAILISDFSCTLEGFRILSPCLSPLSY